MQGISTTIAPDEGQPFTWSQSRPEILGGLLDAPEAGLALGDRRSRAIIAGPPGTGKTMLLGKVLAELRKRQHEGDQLFMIDVGAEISGPWLTEPESWRSSRLMNCSYRIPGSELVKEITCRLLGLTGLSIARSRVNYCFDRPAAGLPAEAAG